MLSFIGDYARQHVDPSVWSSPEFIRTNVFITSVWGGVFSINAVLAWGKMEHFAVSELAYELVSYALLIGAAAFTSWYPKHIRRRRECESPQNQVLTRD
jgi:hypothetical protein